MKHTPLRLGMDGGGVLPVLIPCDGAGEREMPEGAGAMQGCRPGPRPHRPRPGRAGGGVILLKACGAMPETGARRVWRFGFDAPARRRSAAAMARVTPVSIMVLDGEQNDG